MRVHPYFLTHRLYLRIQFFSILEMWKPALSQITTSQRFPARVAMRSNQFRNARVRVELGYPSLHHACTDRSLRRNAPYTTRDLASPFL